MTTMTIPLLTGTPRPAHTTFLRRRLAVTTVLFLLFSIALLAGRTVLAAPDGSPASVAGRSQTSSAESASLVGADAGAGEVPGTPSSAGMARAGGLYLVHPGDTLVSIAAELAPEGARQQFVEQLIALNGNVTPAAGERLVLPA